MRDRERETRKGRRNGERKCIERERVEREKERQREGDIVQE